MPLSVNTLGWFGIGLEADQGTATAITGFVMLTSNGIEATPDVIRKSVYGATRQAERIVRTVKFKIGGPIGHPLYPTMGTEFLLCTFGVDAYLAALAADTCTVAAAVKGQQTLTVANAGALTYTKGAWISVKAAPNQELRQITNITGNGAAAVVLTIKQLDANPGTLTGVAVRQQAQHWFKMKAPNTLDVMTLPTATIEINEAQQFAWQLAGTLFGKTTLKGGKEEVDASHTVACTRMPVRLNRPGGGVTNPWTSWNPSADENADAQRPYTIVDGYVCLPVNNASDDTSSMQEAATVETWEVDLDNGLIDKDFWNQNRVKDTIPGLAKATLKYSYANPYDRPTEFEDFLSQPYDIPVNAFISMSTNMGSTTTPNWRAFGIYCSAATIVKAPTMRPLNDVMTIDVEADLVVGPTGEDAVQVFVINGITSAYAGA